MMKINTIVAVVLSGLFFNCHVAKQTVFERTIDFNEGWRFLEDATVYASAVEFDDSQWRIVDLPHDWSVEDFAVQDSLHIGPFFKAMKEGQDTGYLRGGTGWYRKKWTLSPQHAGKEVYILFDGVQTEMQLWVNGQEVGNHVYGYTPFYFNITPYLNAAGSENQLAIRVHNPEQNSRWFAGAGIYRSVSLIVVNPLHVGIWGVWVNTAHLREAQADLDLSVTLVNRGEQNAEAVVKAEISSPEGSIVSRAEKDCMVAPQSSAATKMMLTVDHPILWDTEHPHLYQAEITVLQQGKPVGRYCQTFGIRTIEFSAEKGFLLNGQPTLLKGACMHHDNGLLGAAAFRRAEYRRVEIMKNNGFNAIRCAHNPPSQYFLDACDELGMLVMDESFDMWMRPKRPNDYHRHYAEWWKKDTEAMLLRDRNHPSVIMWSIGNEVPERAEPSGLVIAREARDFIKALDPTRPVTQAICDFWDNPKLKWDDTAPAFAQMDIACYNYKSDMYESDHAKYPQRIMCGSETFPMQVDFNWELMNKHPFVLGEFVWVGMDYLGEATVGKSLYKSDPRAEVPFFMPWPWYISNMGDIDILGNKKPQSYYRDVVWGQSHLELSVHEPIPAGMHEIVFYWGWPREYQCWNWHGHEGEPLWVSVYSSYPQVRLELNGRVIGQKNISDPAEPQQPFLTSGNLKGISQFRAYFQVPYEPGELKAVGIKDGQEMESRTLATTGPAFALRLQPEEPIIKACKGDIGYVAVAMVDAQGRVIPTDSSQVKINVSGEGRLIGAGNASPLVSGSFQDDEMNLYRGRGLVIVRSTGKKGKITIVAESEGVRSDTAIIQAR